jgi:integrase
MGQLDVASLTRSQWKPGQEYLDCPRNKTGIDRRVWLWPETREALAAAVAKRAIPAKQKWENRLLLTARGFPWSRVESVGTLDVTKGPLAIAKASAGVTKGSFYDLRRTFRTKASPACDLEAIDHCMGHSGKGEGVGYVQEIDDERIRRVCELVRTWLYGAEVAK